MPTESRRAFWKELVDHEISFPPGFQKLFQADAPLGDSADPGAAFRAIRPHRSLAPVDGGAYLRMRQYEGYSAVPQAYLLCAASQSGSILATDSLPSDHR